MSGREIGIKPFLIAVADSTDPLTNIDQIFLFIHDSCYRFESTLAAIDACFKAFKVFNHDYPKETCHVWTLIEKSIYQIEKGAKKFPHLAQTMKNVQDGVQRYISAHPLEGDQETDDSSSDTDREVVEEGGDIEIEQNQDVDQNSEGPLREEPVVEVSREDSETTTGNLLEDLPEPGPTGIEPIRQPLVHENVPHDETSDQEANDAPKKKTRKVVPRKRNPKRRGRF